MSEFLSSLDWPLIGLNLLLGMVLGGLYLLGLWWTVRRAVQTGNRGLLVASFVVRVALLLVPLWFLARVGPQALVAALVGFLLVRWLVTRLVGPGGDADDAVT